MHVLLVDVKAQYQIALGSTLDLLAVLPSQALSGP